MKNEVKTDVAQLTDDQIDAVGGAAVLNFFGFPVKVADHTVLGKALNGNVQGAVKSLFDWFRTGY